ncbi:MAG TPA: WD40 repeat domain-containing protein [Candidatus Poseidoniales archaeon]|jgi:hypothetical protein|nr:WD40 repeat domain-containing protein [Candidatus Poseidoniales archaeon]HIL67321.1 WD40 repeat domain-containing protein [Candidatus Poseidoniales archaeon]
MGKRFSSFIAGIMILLFAPLTMAQSTVTMDSVVILSEVDLGIEGATISPDEKTIIAHGAESTIFVIDSENPLNNSLVDWQGNYSLLDASFHPGGKTALLVGGEGVVLRLKTSNYSIENAGGASTFGNTELKAVSWNGDGSWAYIGGEGGWIWRFRGLDGGGVEAIPLENRGESDINAISCLRGSNVCIVSSSVDGIGIIDQDHELFWIGGYGNPWIDVTCPSIISMECVVISSDLTIARIGMNIEDVSKMMIYDNDIVQLQGFEGTMTGMDIQSDGKSLISLAPFGLIEHDLTESRSFHWLDNNDAVDFNTAISGERIVSTWSTGSFEGWIITNRGTIVSFTSADQREKGTLLEIWIGIIILGGATLTIASLLTSTSPRLSRWLAIKIGSEEERKSAIKEERRLSRKKGRA